MLWGNDARFSERMEELYHRASGWYQCTYRHHQTVRKCERR